MRHLTHLCLIRNCIRSVPFSEKADPEEEKDVDLSSWKEWAVACDKRGTVSEMSER